MPPIREAAAAASAQRALSPAILIALALFAAAAIMRVNAAKGDLWLDEIWSLFLIKEAGSIAGILFGVSHDNNHFLNSIWLYLVGADAPVLAQRGLSIALGAASVFAAGAVFRGDRPGQLFAMALAAMAAPLVAFGSEARGYAGLVLFALSAFALTARLIEGRDARARLWLALVTALGLLSHLTFALALGVAGLWMGVESWRKTRSLRMAERATLHAFTPALAAAAIIGLCIAIGALQRGFTIGGVTPFSLSAFIEGYGGLLRGMLGLPPGAPAGLVLAGLAAALVLAVIKPGAIDRRFASLYLIGLVLAPAAMAIARLPNTGFGRYFLVSGVIFLIFLADLARHGLRNGRGLQIASLALLGSVLVANMLAVAAWDGRVRYSQAIALMGRDGMIVYGSDSPFRTEMTLGYHADRLGVRAVHRPIEDWCRARPDWLVLEQALPEDDDGASLAAAPGCTLAVERVARFPLEGPSGIGWTLYRVAPQH